ncbi:MAG: hypothetical protein L0216_20690, partial [Planctomycetales bacterium]|nr:hypothetical protein [Planctomycetales bacterium]
AESAAAWERAAAAAETVRAAAEALVRAAAGRESAGDLPAARDAAERASAKDPTSLAARERLVALCVRQGDSARVRAVVGPLLADADAPAAVRSERHRVAAAAAAAAGVAGDPRAAAEAVALYGRAAELDPGHVAALEGLREALLATASDGETFARALEPAVAALEAIRPDAALALRARLAEDYAGRLGRPAEAAGHLRAVVARRPQDRPALAALARVLARGPREALAEAVEVHERLLVLDPLRAEGYRALRPILRALGDPPREARAAAAEAACSGQALAPAAEPPAALRPLPGRLREKHLVHPGERGELAPLVALAAPHLDRVFPADLSRAAGRKDPVPRDFERVRETAASVGRMLGDESGEGAAVAWAPSQRSGLQLAHTVPVTILVGPPALEWSERVLRFALGKFLVHAIRGHALPLALGAEALADVVVALATEEGGGRLPGDPALAKKVRGAIPRRQRTEIEEAATRALPESTPEACAGYLEAASLTGARAGYVASGGDLAAALDLLGRSRALAGGGPLPIPQLLRESAEAREVLRFSVSADYAALAAG